MSEPPHRANYALVEFGEHLGDNESMLDIEWAEFVGNRTSDREFDIPPASGWQYWMDAITGPDLVDGENTIQIRRDRESDDTFVVGTVIVHWRAGWLGGCSGPRSSVGGARFGRARDGSPPTGDALIPRAAPSSFRWGGVGGRGGGGGVGGISANLTK